MPVEVVMPRFSDTMEEGKILKWYKHEGDRVEKGEPLLEVETDKANMEMESYESGTLEKIMVKEGQSAPVGAPIAVIQPSKAAVGTTAPARGRPAEAVQAAPSQAELKAPPEKPRAERAEVTEKEERIKASPLARRMAEEHGVDLSAIAGTGPGGRVTEKDIAAFIGERAQERTQPPEVAPPPLKAAQPAPAPTKAAPEEVELVPLNKMQQTIAKRMSQIHATVPAFYVTDEVDMTEAVRLREFLNQTSPEVKVSFNDIVIKAVALALKKFPNVNSFYRDGQFERHPWVNIGIAVSVENGLLVPVLRDADKKDIRTIAAEAAQLIQRTRSEELLPNDLEGGTFTVSNMGMFGVEDFAAIINSPDSAILAVAAIKRKPVVIDDEIAISDRMKITLTCDHRIVYGAEAARFVEEVKRLLENPLYLVM